jgi:hypothetical protein
MGIISIPWQIFMGGLGEETESLIGSYTNSRIRVRYSDLSMEGSGFKVWGSGF